MLDEFALWSFHECPMCAGTPRLGDAIDPWGPYQVVCTQARDRVTLAIVSLGPDDGAAHTDLTTVQSFSP